MVAVESERRQGKGSRLESDAYQVIYLQSRRRRSRRRQHGDVNGPRVHFCNAGVSRARQQVEARVQRPGKLDGVHICNCAGGPPRIAQSLHTAVALAIRRMRTPIFTPVARVARAPFRLGASLVVAIVAVVTEPVALPVASPGALTSLRRAISLAGDMRQRRKRVAAGKTKAGRFHGPLQVRLRRAHAEVPTCHGGLWCVRDIHFSDRLACESHTFRTSHGRRCLETHMFRSAQSHWSARIGADSGAPGKCDPIGTEVRTRAAQSPHAAATLVIPAGNLRRRRERVAASKAEAGRFHGAL